MADRGDTHNRVGSLNRWFAVSSLLLALSVSFVTVMYLLSKNRARRGQAVHS